MALATFKRDHDSVIVDGFVTGLRGELVGSLRDQPAYSFANASWFNSTIADCAGSITTPTKFDVDSNDAVTLLVSFPAIDAENNVQGTVSFLVQFPPALHDDLAATFGPAVLGMSLFTAIIGVMFICVFYWYRKTVVIKMASPAFLMISVIGAILTSFGIYFLVLPPEADSAVCYTRTFLLPLGFNLFFTPLFMKSYRVYQIFAATLGTASKKLKTAKFRNSYVFIRVGIFFLLQLALCGMGMLVPDSPTFVEEELFNTTSLQRTLVPYCSQSIPYLVLSIIYNMGLILFGATVSVLGRKYPTAFNESVYLMITINVLASFSLLILPAQYLLEDRQGLGWLNAIGGHLVLWVGMGLVFGSKIVPIVQGTANQKVTLVFNVPPRAHSSSDSASGSNKDKQGTSPHLGPMTALELQPKTASGSTSKEPITRQETMSPSSDSLGPGSLAPGDSLPPAPTESLNVSHAPTSSISVLSTVSPITSAASTPMRLE